jgi:hypothetical protein
MRADVVKALGEPVFKMTDFLVEHRPQEGTGPIYVEYRLKSEFVERIEVKLTAPVDRAAIFQALKLSSPAGSKLGSDGALVEYFGGGASIVLAYAGAQASSGVTAINYYSDRLFENEVKRAGAQMTGGAGTPATGTATGGTTAAGGGAAGGAVAPPPPPPPPPPPNTATPTAVRDPLACYDLYTWSQQEEDVARRARQVPRRQMAMDIRIRSQSGDCESARALAGQYKQRFLGQP